MGTFNFTNRRKNYSGIYRKIFIILISVILVSASSKAQTTYDFIGGGGDNLWSNVANWDANGIPPQPMGGSDEILIDHDCTMNVNISAKGNFTIDPGFTLTMPSTTFFINTNVCNLWNFGTLVVNTLAFAQAGVFFNYGVVVNNGRITDNAGSFSNYGTYKGTGTYEGFFPNTLGGTVAPGNAIGCLSFTSGLGFQSSGIIEIEIGGVTACTQFDQLQVSGQANLTGSTINVTFPGGFNPFRNAEFLVVNADSWTGTPTITFPAGYNIAYIGSGKIKMLTILAVELTSFNAKLVNNKTVQLDWRSSGEYRNAGFAIERSINGTNYEKIGFIPGAGNSTVEKNYQFIDNDPQAAINYYRLKQIDFDGKFNYSDVRVVKKDEIKPEIYVYPNPVSGRLFIANKQPGSVLKNVRLISLSGNMMFESSRALTELDMSSYPSGTYILVCTDTNGKQASQKVIKIR